jgi:putative FmdB family regulatory protein|tara:strand:+ start:1266 stop:1550 length:285 start_codon:yes stop_codon:yes gene_type:complete
MPRYPYECKNCGEWLIVFHGFEETFSDCEKCGHKDTMKKLLSTPLAINKKSIDISDKKLFCKKVGELTREYIEENRKVLKEQKKEAKKKSYESS